MVHKIKGLLFSFLLVANVQASNTILSNLDDNDIDLYPAIHHQLTNGDQTIATTCQILLAKQEHHSILIEIEKGSGMFNGISLSAGESRWQSFYNNVSMPVKINPNSVFTLTNHGLYAIKIRCA